MATRESGRSRDTVSCEAGKCRATGRKWCACISVADGRCACEAMITAGQIVHKIEGLDKKKRYKLNSSIQFCSKKAALLDIATFLDRTFPYYHISIPIANAKKKVNLSVKDKTLGELISSLGLLSK